MSRRAAALYGAIRLATRYTSKEYCLVSGAAALRVITDSPSMLMIIDAISPRLFDTSPSLLLRAYASGAMILCRRYVLRCQRHMIIC